jgi:hypothetical protein
MIGEGLLRDPPRRLGRDLVRGEIGAEFLTKVWYKKWHSELLR